MFLIQPMGEPPHKSRGRAVNQKRRGSGAADAKYRDESELGRDGDSAYQEAKLRHLPRQPAGGQQRGAHFEDADSTSTSSKENEGQERGFVRIKPTQHDQCERWNK